MFRLKSQQVNSNFAKSVDKRSDFDQTLTVTFGHSLLWLKDNTIMNTYNPQVVFSFKLMDNRKVGIYIYRFIFFGRFYYFLHVNYYNWTNRPTVPYWRFAWLGVEVLYKYCKLRLYYCMIMRFWGDYSYMVFRMDKETYEIDQ